MAVGGLGDNWTVVHVVGTSGPPFVPWNSARDGSAKQKTRVCSSSTLARGAPGTVLQKEAEGRLLKWSHVHVRGNRCCNKSPSSE